MAVIYIKLFRDKDIITRNNKPNQTVHRIPIRVWWCAGELQISSAPAKPNGATAQSLQHLVYNFLISSTLDKHPKNFISQDTLRLPPDYFSIQFVSRASIYAPHTPYFRHGQVYNLDPQTCHVLKLTAAKYSLTAAEQRELQSRMERKQMQQFMSVRPSIFHTTFYLCSCSSDVRPRTY
jgi:hypothetical protein